MQLGRKEEKLKMRMTGKKNMEVECQDVRKLEKLVNGQVGMNRVESLVGSVKWEGENREKRRR